MPPAAVLRRQLGAGGLAVLLGAAGAELLRITVAVYPTVCCSVNHKKKTKKEKKINQKNTNSVTKITILELAKFMVRRRPKKDLGISQDAEKTKKKEKKNQKSNARFA